MITSTGGRLGGLDELWDLREVLRGTGPGVGLPLPLLEGLRRLLGADAVGFNAMDATRRQSRFQQAATEDGVGETTEVDDATDPEAAAWWSHYWTTPSISYHDRTGDLAAVVLRSDFLSDRQWRAHPLYVDHLRPTRFYAVRLALPDGGPGRALRLVAFRERGHDFTEQDRFLMELLRPHVAAAYRRAQAHRLWDRSTSTGPSGTQVPRLTPRQRQVLALVRDGATNASIAHRLGIAEGTVRKHLEHIHATLGVSSRTAAAVAAEGMV